MGPANTSVLIVESCDSRADALLEILRAGGLIAMRCTDLCAADAHLDAGHHPVLLVSGVGRAVGERRLLTRTTTGARGGRTTFPAGSGQDQDGEAWLVPGYRGFADIDANISADGLVAQVFAALCDYHRQLSTAPERPDSRHRDGIRDSARQWLELTSENVGVMLVYLDAELRYRFLNRAASSLLGGSRDGLLGKHIGQVVGDEAYAVLDAPLQQALAGTSSSCERMLESGDGETAWISETFVPDLANGQVLGLFGCAIDTTEYKRVELALRHSEERLQNLYDSAPDIHFTLARDGEILSVNQFGADILRRTKSELLSTPLYDVVHPDDVDLVRPWIGRLFANDADGSDLDCRVLGADASVLWVQSRARLETDAEGVATELRLVCRDITQAHDLSVELSYQATHDALTGLVNRRELESRLARVLASARKDRTEHALCYLDLDQFKVINDTCGHVAGDELLRQLGEVLSTKVRRRDTLARLGGDEFAVLMEHCSLMQARRVANSMRTTVDEFRFIWRDKRFTIGVSIGLVPISGESESVAALLSAADSACYLAKDHGRNRIHVYHEDDLDLAQRHGEMEWVGRLRRALDEDRFRLFYQPIVRIAGLPCAEDDSGHYVELLLRMEDEDGSLVPPGAFLPAAERFNLAIRVDRWVVNRVLDWLRESASIRNGLAMCSVNLSGLSVADDGFLEFILERLAQPDVPCNKLCFEITETAAISKMASATRFITSLQKLGCRFALDDFGSGLSSFAYLKGLPVDFLKIDGVFVKDIVEDVLDHAMVRSINEIGQIMGKKTIAEFVENDQILDSLREIGVDYAQGYGVGRPQPIERLFGPVSVAIDEK